MAEPIRAILMENADDDRPKTL